MEYLVIHGLKMLAYLMLVALGLLVVYEYTAGHREGAGVQASSILLAIVLVSLF